MGGKRIGTGRPTDKPNRKTVSYRLDADIADRFGGSCRLLRVPVSAVLEKMMAEWISMHWTKIRTATEELQKLGEEEFFKQPARTENLQKLELDEIEYRVYQLNAFEKKIEAIKTSMKSVAENAGS